MRWAAVLLLALVVWLVAAHGPWSRSGPDAPWTSFTAERHAFLDEPARSFPMHASRGGLPVDAYHAFATSRTDDPR